MNRVEPINGHIRLTRGQRLEDMLYIIADGGHELSSKDALALARLLESGWSSIVIKNDDGESLEITLETKESFLEKELDHVSEQLIKIKQAKREQRYSFQGQGQQSGTVPPLELSHISKEGEK